MSIIASPFDSFAPAHFSFQAAHALSIRWPLGQPYSRRVDATSLPGSCGTLRGAIASLSSAHPPGCLVRPSDCFAGYDAAPAARRCGVARSGETAAGIDSLAPARLALTGLPAANLPKQLPQLRVAQRSRLQKSANGIQRPSWDLISASLECSCSFVSFVFFPADQMHFLVWRRIPSIKLSQGSSPAAWR